MECPRLRPLERAPASTWTSPKLAEDADDPSDPTVAWPEQRQHVTEPGANLLGIFRALQKAFYERLSMKGFLCRRLGHGRSRSAGCRGDSGSVGTGVGCPRAAGVVHGRCNRSDDSEGFCASASLGHHQLSPTSGKVWRASGPPSGWVCQSARVGCDHRSLDGSGIDDRHTPWLAEGRVCNATDGEAPRAAGLLIGPFSVLPCSSRRRHDLAGTSELAF